MFEARVRMLKGKEGRYSWQVLSGEVRLGKWAGTESRCYGRVKGGVGRLGFNYIKHMSFPAAHV